MKVFRLSVDEIEIFIVCCIISGFDFMVEFISEE